MTDVEEEGGNGSVALDVDHAQVVGKVALPGTDEEQPAGTENSATGGCWVTGRDRRRLSP